MGARVQMPSPLHSALKADEAVSGRAADGTGLVTLILIALPLIGVDALLGIAPLGDDYWIALKAPGSLSIDYLKEYGWAARPLGIFFMDLVNAIAQSVSAPYSLVLLILRGLLLWTTYLTLYRLWNLPRTTAIVAVVLFALTPAAVEAWSLLSTIHVEVSVTATLLVSGWWMRALRNAECRPLRAREIALLALGQVLVYALYEQPLLAIPTLIVALLVHAVLTRRLPFRRALSLGMVVVGMAALWIGALTASGFAAARSARLEGVRVSGAEWSDLGGAVTSLLTAFVEQHVWRLTVLLRGRGEIADAGVAGVVSVVALAAVVFGIWRVTTAVGRRERKAEAHSSLVLAAIMMATAVAAILPFGLAYPAFPRVSRVFYLPGAFLAIAAAIAIAACARSLPRITAVATALFLTLCAIEVRYYLGETRMGAHLVSVLAERVGVLSEAEAEGGVLIIAPDVIGTFSTPFVQTFSFRAAVQLLEGKTIGGPLYFAANCRAAQGAGRGIEDERGAAVSQRNFSRVLTLVDGNARLSRSVGDACDLHASSLH